MELFSSRSNTEATIAECAELVIATTPAVMHAIRREMRSRRPAELSVPQFRALIYLQVHAGASVSDVAEHLGLALSSTSQLIDGLLKRHYVTREVVAEDRRCATLSLTDSGETMLETIRAQAQAGMEERLAPLSAEDRQAVVIAMTALSRIFQKRK